MKKLLVFVILTLVLSACNAALENSQNGTPGREMPITNDPNEPVSSDQQGSGPVATPDYLPKSEDAQLSRGKAYIKSAEMVVRESYPPQISLQIEGELPTPCNDLRAAISQPDVNNRIDVEVYSVIDPDMICIQTVAPFSEVINLGSFSAGHYTVYVNGEKVGEFDS